MDWAGGSAPDVTSGSGKRDVYTFFSLDEGTIWYGFAAGLSGFFAFALPSLFFFGLIIIISASAPLGPDPHHHLLAAPGPKTYHFLLKSY